MSSINEFNWECDLDASESGSWYDNVTNAIASSFSEFTLSSGKQFKPVPVTVNKDLLRALYKLPQVAKWYGKAFLTNKATSVVVDAQSVIDTTGLKFDPTLYSDIERNENLYLFAQYLLRKEYREKDYLFLKLSQPVEIYLFHSTPKRNIPSICENNFDWRRYGTARGSKYGQGVNFTKKLKFSKIFPHPDTEKCVIISRVLNGEVEIGYEHTRIPSLYCDTTCSDGTRNQVFVKYDDNEFYPEYIINL